MSRLPLVAAVAALCAPVSACGSSPAPSTVTASITACTDSSYGFSADYTITNGTDLPAIVTPSFTVNSQVVPVGLVKAISVPAHASVSKSIVSYSYVPASPGAIKCGVSLLVS